MSEDRDYSMIMPFWIDTSGYTGRDREMFVCGVEFNMVYEQLKTGWSGSRPIHRENESRIRMMCGKMRVDCKITPHEGYEGCETWSDLDVF